MDPRDFSDNFHALISNSVLDLDVYLDRHPFLIRVRKKEGGKVLATYLRVIKKSDIYVFHFQWHLCISFSSILVRLYVNYVFAALSDFDATLKDEGKMLTYIYQYETQALYNFWNLNVYFFMIF